MATPPWATARKLNRNPGRTERKSRSRHSAKGKAFSLMELHEADLHRRRACGFQIVRKSAKSGAADGLRRSFDARRARRFASAAASRTCWRSGRSLMLAGLRSRRMIPVRARLPVPLQSAAPESRRSRSLKHGRRRYGVIQSADENAQATATADGATAQSASESIFSVYVLRKRRPPSVPTW